MLLIKWVYVSIRVLILRSKCLDVDTKNFYAICAALKILTDLKSDFVADSYKENSEKILLRIRLRRGFKISKQIFCSTIYRMKTNNK